MTIEDDSTQVKTLPSGHVTVVHKKTSAVVLIDSRGGITDSISLTITQAMKLQKLLSMSGDPVPTYRGKKEFFLAADTPQSEDASPYPVVTAGANNVRVLGSDNDEVELQPRDSTALSDVLVDWRIEMTSDSSPDASIPQRSILSLPAMIQLGDGITEPLLHAEYDEILEHYHRAVGYWSPENGEYVTEH